MEKEIAKQIWEELDKKRAAEPISLELLKKTLEDFESDVKYENIHELIIKLSTYKQGEYSTPRLFHKVISEITKDRDLNSVLIPFEKDGSVTSWGAKKIGEKGRIESFIVNPPIYELVKPYLRCVPSIYNEDFLKSEKNFDPYDLVVSDLPWGMRKIKETYKMDDNEYEIRDTLEMHILLKSALKLKKDGMGIYTVAGNFFLNSRRDGVHKHLEKFGLYVDSILQMPAGTYANTGIPANILIISRKQKDGIFLAQVTEDNIKQVITNYQKRRAVDVPELGSVVERNELKPPSVIFELRRAQKFAKRMKAEKYSMNEIIKEINLPDRDKKGGGFSDMDKSIYLPKIGNSDIVLSKDDFNIKSQNYIQIIFKNKEDIDIEFLSEFLNTSEGIRLRKTWSVGTVIENITKTSLLNGEIYLPPKDYQKKVVELQSSIIEFESLLSEGREKLWSNISEISDVEEVVSKLKRINSLEVWLEDLPFPLASIIWRYRAQKEARDKVESLLLFFESSAQFLATIFLSASYYDKEWVQILVDDDTDLSKAQFGLWTMICEKGMKNLRRYLSGEVKGEGDKAKFYENLKSKNDEYISAISDKRLQKVFNEAKAVRNELAHEGFCSEHQYIDYLGELEELLITYRGVISIIFASINLVTPITSKYRNGININKVFLLNGTRTPFQQTRINTIEQLEDGRLYLYDSKFETALKLLPLLKLDSSPTSERNALYFYNKIESDGELYISYHLDEQAKKKYQGAELSKRFKKIKNLIKKERK